MANREIAFVVPLSIPSMLSRYGSLNLKWKKYRTGDWMREALRCQGSKLGVGDLPTPWKKDYGNAHICRAR